MDRNTEWTMASNGERRTKTCPYPFLDSEIQALLAVKGGL